MTGPISPLDVNRLKYKIYKYLILHDSWSHQVSISTSGLFISMCNKIMYPPAGCHIYIYIHSLVPLLVTLNKCEPWFIVWWTAIGRDNWRNFSQCPWTTPASSPAEDVVIALPNWNLCFLYLVIYMLYSS